jgi:hypothetical protein
MKPVVMMLADMSTSTMPKKSALCVKIRR